VKFRRLAGFSSPVVLLCQFYPGDDCAVAGSPPLGAKESDPVFLVKPYLQLGADQASPQLGAPLMRSPLWPPRATMTSRQETWRNTPTAWLFFSTGINLLNVKYRGPVSTSTGPL
jgi:hypothetical protein